MHFKLFARQVLKVLEQDMCKMWPFSMPFAYRELIAKRSLQLLRHEDVSNDKMGFVSLICFKHRSHICIVLTEF